MALYIDATRVRTAKPSTAFEGKLSPGSKVPHSGIYRCVNCNSEIAANAGDPLPPQNHAQHPKHDGKIEWQLLVYAQYD